MNQHQRNKVNLSSSIEDIVAHNDTLWTKFQYNIRQLSEKTLTLTGMLRKVTEDESKNTKEEMEYAENIIRACLGLQDTFLDLDVLQKKTELLKNDTEQILKNLELQLTSTN